MVGICTNRDAGAPSAVSVSTNAISGLAPRSRTCDPFQDRRRAERAGHSADSHLCYKMVLPKSVTKSNIL
jgi:hypothetical protein